VFRQFSGWQGGPLVEPQNAGRQDGGCLAEAFVRGEARSIGAV
jgi:hypothetical protein